MLSEVLGDKQLNQADSTYFKTSPHILLNAAGWGVIYSRNVQ